jgi:hypothetical protein
MSSEHINGMVRPCSSPASERSWFKFNDGEKKIVVPPDTPIVGYMPGDKSGFKAGVKIFIAAAKKQPDGTLQAPRINYGKEVPPPM